VSAVTTEALPPRVRQLLATDIDSFEKLQIVQLTAGKREDRWTFLRLAGEINVDDSEVKPLTGELIAAGILAPDGDDGTRYDPRTAEIDAAVQELITCYRDDTLLVVRAITDRAFAKIRHSVASTFADAFVIRRPKPPEPSDG